jgi:hypothetical protein
MGEGTEAAPGAESTQGALLEVVKGLRHEPPLLFGIGAGLVLVAILAATTSVAVVAIVAVVLIAALAAWLFRETKARVSARSRTDVRSDDAKIARDALVGGIDTPDDGDYETKVQADRAEIAEGANVGGIRIGGSRPRKED